MNIHIKTQVALLLAGVLTTSMSGQETEYLPLDAPQFKPPEDVRYVADRRFTPMDGPDLRLSLASPLRPKEKCPGIICIHGGAWSSGKRESLSVILELARRGYVAVTVDYRLSPKHPFPAQIRDVRTAVRWMRAHADELGVDPDRIGVVGYSAGAHLAALLATASPDPEDTAADAPYARFRDNVQAAACYYGIYDMCAFHQWNIEQSTKPELDFKNRWAAQVACLTLNRLFGGDPETCLPIYRSASPIEHVSERTPPFFLSHGTADTLAPYQQSEQFATRLRKAGVKNVQLQILEGAEHSYGSGIGGTHSQKADAALFDFLHKNLLTPTDLR